MGAITSLALCAIDTALWDMRCRRSGRPLHIEAGGAQTSVPLYTTEGGWLHIDASELIEDALRAKERGFGGSKIKIGRPPKEDVARLTAVREAVGDDFEIMVDGNQGATVDEAIRRARLYEPLRPRLVRGADAGRGPRRPHSPFGLRPRCRSPSAS